MSGNVMEITSDQFEAEVIGSDKPTVVDFWAPWCGPCRMVGPVIEELAKDHADKIKVVKVNVDENQDIAGKYQVFSIPTVALFEGGAITKQVVGARDKAAFEAEFGL